MRITSECPCGKEISVAEWQLRSGRGKYCSNQCKWEFKTTTQLVEHQIQPGQRLSPETEIKEGQRLSVDNQFPKGYIPWNKGLKFGTCNTNSVSYTTLHTWIRRHKGPAKNHSCVNCGNQAMDWANISHEYYRDLNDYQPMCRICHIDYDKGYRGASLKVEEKR